MPEGMLWLVTLAQSSGVFGSCVSTVVLWRMRGRPARRWHAGMRCCVRIWTSGSAAWCSARRRRSWVGAGSRRSRWRRGCIRTRWPRGCGSSRDLERPVSSRSGRVRAPGGGRKPATETDPGLAPALTALVDPETRGDPESPLVWTTKSTRNLADALTAGGHRVSDRTVARMLRAQGFSLQANAKVTEGRQHADRDAQFGYLNAAVIEHLAVGGAGGQRGHQEEGTGRASSRTGAGSTSPGSPRCASTCTTSRTRNWARRSRTASTTSPRTPAGCRSAPTTTPPRSPWKPCAAGGTPWADTATRDTDRLLICADGGGSNGYRVRAWKIELAALRRRDRPDDHRLPPTTLDQPDMTAAESKRGR